MRGRHQQQPSPVQPLENGIRKEENDARERDGNLEAFAFGRFRVVPQARLLEREGFPMPLRGRGFDLLCLFVRRPGEVISKGELLAKVWPDVNVEEGSLRFHIAQLRRTLGEGQNGERYVVNVSGRGYCFVSTVEREATPTERHVHSSPSYADRAGWLVAV